MMDFYTREIMLFDPFVIVSQHISKDLTVVAYWFSGLRKCPWKWKDK